MALISTHVSRVLPLASTPDSPVRSVRRGRFRGGRVAAAVAICAIALTGCAGAGASSSSTAAAGTAAAGSVAGKKVILVHCGDVNPWCAVYNKTIIDGLQAAGVSTEYLQDPFDVNLEIQNLQSAISKRPDLILVSPTDDNSIVPSLQQAHDQGVPVIINNSMPVAAAKDLVTATVNADQAALGRYAAMNIVAGLKAEGLTEGNVIALAGSDTTATSGDRMTAFKEELAKTPQFKLVEEHNTNWDPAAAGTVASQLYAAYQSKGGIQAVYGMADYLANAAIQSATQAGMPVGVAKKGLIVSGSNCFKVGIDNITAGLQYGTATQAPDAEGKFVVEWVLKFLAGEQIPKVNLNTENQVTADNVAQFAAGCSKA